MIQQDPWSQNILALHFNCFDLYLDYDYCKLCSKITLYNYKYTNTFERSQAKNTTGILSTKHNISPMQNENKL